HRTHVNPSYVTESRAEIEVRDRRLDEAWGDAVTGNHERYAGRAFKEAHLEPQAALAQHLAMVRAEDDDRVVGHARTLERILQFAQLVVYVRNIGEIAAPRTPYMLGRDFERGIIACLVEALRMRILLLIRDEPDCRLKRRAVLVQIPVLPPSHERIVRMGEGHHKAPRPAPRIVGNARKLVELLVGVESDLVVI